jgi:stage II sporulation protein P
VTLNAYAGDKFDLYIDMHRDAYTDGQVQTCSYGGESAAKLMVLIGSGENFNVKPFYQENYAFALSLTDAVNAVCPGLCRDVMVKTGRYNQHIGVDSILVEVGNNRNTLEQALASMPALADAIEKVLVPGDDEKIITVSSEN